MNVTSKNCDQYSVLSKYNVGRYFLMSLKQFNLNLEYAVLFLLNKAQVYAVKDWTLFNLPLPSYGFVFRFSKYTQPTDVLKLVSVVSYCPTNLTGQSN